MWKKRRPDNDDRQRVVKDPERSRERTMNRAFRLLAAKPRSEQELRERLLEKLWTDESIVDAVIAKLKDYNYLNDEQYAKDIALSKLRQRPQGKRRLQQAMSQKRLDREIVDDAIRTAFEKMPEAELIEAAIAKRLRLKGRPETREDLKKFYDHLLLKGFSYGLIREKLDAAIAAAEDEESDAG